MATKAEIIEKLSQCGGLAYQDWVALLDSIYFDGEVGNIYQPITGTVLPTPEGDVDKFSIVPAGTYTFPGQAPLVVAPNTIGILNWDSQTETWSLGDPIEVPEPDLSGLVSKADLAINSLILPSSSYIKQNTIIASNGNVGTGSNYTGAVSIVDFPLDPNTTYTLGGFLASADKSFALANASGGVTQVSNLSSLPKTFTTTSEFRFLRAFIKYTNAVEPGDNWTQTLMLNKGTTLQNRLVSKIDNIALSAAGLEVGNKVPTPTQPDNAVNLSYMVANALLKSGLTVQRSNNLADPNAIIPDKYINSSGGIVSPAVGWKMIAIDVSGVADGAPITVGRFAISTGGYTAFYNGVTLVQYNGAFTNSSLPLTLIKPVGATILYVDISRPTGVNEYSQITANLGTDLLPYQPFATITEINGYKVSGSGGSSNVQKFIDLSDVPDNIYAGNANKGLKINPTGNGVDVFNPVLEDSDVSFNSVSANSWVINNLPEGAGSPPVGVQIGDAWIDTTNDTIKVRRS